MLSSSDLLKILNQAEEIAARAGEICLEMQTHLSGVRYKSAKDVVTEADIASDHHIRSALRAAFPDYAIRTEESGYSGESRELTWIVDPIDGTVNFSRGMPLWGISMALTDAQGPLLAVCVLPRLNECFTAIRGQGARLNGQTIRVSATSDLAQAIVSNGDFNVGPSEGIPALNARNLSIFATQARHCLRVKCVGSAVVEGCFVACGRLDLYSMTISYPWDIAGVSLLVREAGGRVTGIDGSPLRFADGEPVLFSNGILHDAYLRAFS